MVWHNGGQGPEKRKYTSFCKQGADSIMKWYSGKANKRVTNYHQYPAKNV
jgi:hypothetical protein